MVIDSTDALKKLFVRLSKKLSMPTLCPNDSLKPDVMAKINSLDLIANILSADSKLSDFYTYPEFRIDETNGLKYESLKKLINSSILVSIFLYKKNPKNCLCNKAFLKDSIDICNSLS